MGISISVQFLGAWFFLPMQSAPLECPPVTWALDAAASWAELKADEAERTSRRRRSSGSSRVQRSSRRFEQAVSRRLGSPYRRPSDQRPAFSTAMVKVHISALVESLKGAGSVGSFGRLDELEQRRRVIVLTKYLQKLEVGLEGKSRKEEIREALVEGLRDGDALSSMSELADRGYAANAQLVLSCWKCLCSLGLAATLASDEHVRRVVIESLRWSEGDSCLATFVLPCACAMRNEEAMKRLLRKHATNLIPLLSRLVSKGRKGSVGAQGADGDGTTDGQACSEHALALLSTLRESIAQRRRESHASNVLYDGSARPLTIGWVRPLGVSGWFGRARTRGCALRDSVDV